MIDSRVDAIKENVIQGRKTKDDFGGTWEDDELEGTPGVLELTQEALDQGVSAKEIIEGLTAGMGIVGEKFSTREYFIPDMLASAEAVGAAMDVLKPYMVDSDIESKGLFAIATVKADIHDIGKNIVSIIIKGAGYEVVDLGQDVPTEKIIEFVKQKHPNYLGLSAMLTTTMVVMRDVIEALEDNGLRGTVKIFVGGAPLSREFAEEIGADVYCVDGFEAVKALDSF